MQGRLEDNSTKAWKPSKKERQAKQEELEKRRQIEKESFDKKLSEGRIKQWDYKHIRLDYKGRGITQEINILDIDGERIRGWTDNFSQKEVPSLPEIFEKLGNEGWEMVSHVVNQDLTQNGVTLHYYNFKREKLWVTTLKIIYLTTKRIPKKNMNQRKKKQEESRISRQKIYLILNSGNGWVN